jgi:hypothetical protein
MGIEGILQPPTGQNSENKVLKLMEQTPLPRMVESLLKSVADAQDSITKKTIESLVLLADAQNGVALPGETQKRSLLELGFTPSFFHIAEATITARVAFTQTESTEFHAGAAVGVTYGLLSASMSAGYSNKYSFETSAASEIRARVVSVPAPRPLSARLEALSKKK